LEERGELLGMALHQPECWIDRAAQPDQPGLAVLGLEPRGVELVMHGSRAEIPQNRLAVASKQRPAAELVALPLADLRRRDVADVVDVEDQKRAELGRFECLAHPREPIAVQPAIVDAFLEIHPHGAERRQRAAPVVARVDILGADLADRLVHGGSPCVVVLAMRRSGAFYSKLFIAGLFARLHNYEREPSPVSLVMP